MRAVKYDPSPMTVSLVGVTLENIRSQASATATTRNMSAVKLVGRPDVRPRNSTSDADTVPATPSTTVTVKLSAERTAEILDWLIRHHEMWDAKDQEIGELILAKLANRTDRYVVRSRGSKVPYTTAADRPLDLSILRRRHAVSVFDTSKTGTCKWVAADVDDHKDQKLDTLGLALQVVQWFEERGFHPLLVRSSKNSFHVWVKFHEPIPHLQAYRLIDRVRADTSCWADDDNLDIEIRPTNPPKNEPSLGSSLRLPGFHPIRNIYSGFTYDCGKTWLVEPAPFIEWLKHPGDDPAELTPDILGELSVAEIEATRKEKERAEAAHARKVERTFYRDRPATYFDNEIWAEAKLRADDVLTWDDVLAGMFVRVSVDLWARNSSEDHCASTATGGLIVFGSDAAAAFNLEPGKRYTKWRLYEHIHNSTGAPGTAIELLKQLNCWPEDPPADSSDLDELEGESDIVQLQPKSQKKELRVPLDVGPVRSKPPTLKVDHKIPIAQYRKNIVDKLLERSESENREPLIVVNELKCTDVLVDFLRQTKLYLVIVTKTIGAAHTLCNSLQKKFERPDTDDPKVDIWDSRRLEDTASGLPLNCNNDQVTVATGMGFSGGAAVCNVCTLREDCALIAQRRLAVKAQHLIVPASTLSHAGLEAFGKPDLIVALDCDPHDVLHLSVSTEKLPFVLDRMEDALKTLATSPEFQRGEIPSTDIMEGSKVVCVTKKDYATPDGKAERAARLEEWRQNIIGFIQHLRYLLETGHAPDRLISVTKSHPSYAVAWLFRRIEPWEKDEFRSEDDNGDLSSHEFEIPKASVGAVLRAAEHGSFPVIVGDELHVSVTRVSHEIPLICLMSEPKEKSLNESVSDRPRYETIEFPPPAKVTDDTRIIQNVLPLNLKDKPRRYQRVLRAVIDDHLAEKVLVVTHPKFIASVKEMQDDRVVRILTFHQAAADCLEGFDLVVCLGSPRLRDIEVSPSESKGSEMQIIGLQAEDGCFSEVRIRTYRDPHLMQEQGRLIRQKLGNLSKLGGPKTVIVTDRFTGYPLANVSLVPETNNTSEVRRILDKSSTALTVGLVRTCLQDRGMRIDRRGVAYCLQVTIDGCRYVELTPCGIGSKCHSVTLVKEYIRSCYDTMSRIVNMGKTAGDWVSRGDVAFQAHISESTATRHIKKLLNAGLIKSNGRRGRAVLYRATDSGRAAVEDDPSLQQFQIEGGIQVEATPPRGWDGVQRLYGRADLLKWNSSCDGGSSLYARAESVGHLTANDFDFEDI